MAVIALVVVGFIVAAGDVIFTRLRLEPVVRSPSSSSSSSSSSTTTAAGTKAAAAAAVAAAKESSSTAVVITVLFVVVVDRTFVGCTRARFRPAALFVVVLTAAAAVVVDERTDRLRLRARFFCMAAGSISATIMLSTAAAVAGELQKALES